MENEEMIQYTCECGVAFERKKIPDEWMQTVPFKWKHQYCDACYKKRVEKALERLPEILKALSKG